MSYWNTNECGERYKTDFGYLFDIEKILLTQSIEEIGLNSKNIKILDLGFGGGRTTFVLDNLNFDIYGIEINKYLSKYVSNMLNNKNIEFGDAMNLNFESNFFDIVLFSHNGIDYMGTIEERNKCLNGIFKILKTNGFFIFSSHIFNKFDFKNYKIILKNYKNLFKKEGYYVDNLDGFDVSTYYNNSVSIISKSFQDIGFELIRFSSIIQFSDSILKLFLRKFFSWERYYLFRKK